MDEVVLDRDDVADVDEKPRKTREKCLKWEQTFP
jgi:hypothetical protein